ncbi:MAG TPA: hypothetical protein VEK08_15205 [Planctomycetota bacterium]|nr:hypothetical protein [Planctomycetota bacterium]
MSHEKNWQQIKKLGLGGQGEVWQVIQRQPEKHYPDRLKAAVKGIASSVNVAGSIDKAAAELFEVCKEIIADNVNPVVGALKILHPPDKAKNSATAEQRLQNEIKAMQNNKHPNLLRILDADPESLWYVSEYHPHGPLSKNACLPNASQLLTHLDRVLRQLQSGSGIIGGQLQGGCKACGIGEYECVVNRDGTDARNFGIQPAGSRRMRIFACKTCGHVQMFTDSGTPPVIWNGPARILKE